MTKIMKVIWFRLLFWQHKVLQFIGLKSKDNCIIKIWWDEKMQDTLLYANVRSGRWHMPAGRMCEPNKDVYSFWLASVTKTSEYGLEDGKKNKTIYTLTEVKEKAKSENLETQNQ